MQVKKLALLGFGNAGQAFARLLLDKEDEIRRKYGCQVKVSAIATNSRGNLEDDDGIDLEEALSDIESCLLYTSLLPP